MVVLSGLSSLFCENYVLSQFARLNEVEQLKLSPSTTSATADKFITNKPLGTNGPRDKKMNQTKLKTYVCLM